MRPHWSVLPFVLPFAAFAWAAEPIDVGSPRLRLSTSLAAPPARDAEPASPTFSERTRQPAAELQAVRAAREGELLQAMESAARQQRAMQDLESRLERARSERTMNPLVLALLVAVVAVTAGAGALWWRLRGSAGAARTGAQTPGAPQASS